MKLPTIPPGLAGKIVKYRPLSEPIRLPDSARSQAWKELRQYKVLLVHGFFQELGISSSFLFSQNEHRKCVYERSISRKKLFQTIKKAWN